MKQGHDELRQDNRETRILLEDLRSFTRAACSQRDVRVTKLERKVFPKASHG